MRASRYVFPPPSVTARALCTPEKSGGIGPARIEIYRHRYSPRRAVHLYPFASSVSARNGESKLTDNFFVSPARRHGGRIISPLSEFLWSEESRSGSENSLREIVKIPAVSANGVTFRSDRRANVSLAVSEWKNSYTSEKLRYFRSDSDRQPYISESKFNSVKFKEYRYARQALSPSETVCFSEKKGKKLIRSTRKSIGDTLRRPQ